MNTQVFALTANTTLVALTGRYLIRKLTYQTAAAGTLAGYDVATTTLTQSNPAFTERAVTDPYTRTSTEDDLVGNEIVYNYTGIATEDETVAADPTAALPTALACGNAAAGSVIIYPDVNTARGLTLRSTVNATVTVEYITEQ